MTGALGTRLPLFPDSKRTIARRLWIDTQFQPLSRSLPVTGGAASAVYPPGSVEAAPTPWRPAHV